MFLVNSRLGQFTAASPDKVGRRRPFSRSYRTNLPNSLAMNHSNTLEYSSRLPVLVCGTGTLQLSLEVFPGSQLTTAISLPEGSEYYQVSAQLTDLPENCIPTPFNLVFRHEAGFSLLRYPVTLQCGTGILTRFPSASPPAGGYTLGPD